MSVSDFMSDLAELVLEIVDAIPPGRVATYGHVAEAVKQESGRGSARFVGNVMSTYGAAVPWWRVVRADGSLPRHLRDLAALNYTREGTPLVMTKPLIVDVGRALWEPAVEPHDWTGKMPYA